MSKEWSKSKHKILGEPAERRKIPNEPAVYEYRVKLPLGEIWRYHPLFDQYIVLTGSYQAAKELRKAGAKLISGWVEPSLLTGGEEWTFMFHEVISPAVLRILKNEPQLETTEGTA